MGTEVQCIRNSVNEVFTLVDGHICNAAVSGNLLQAYKDCLCIIGDLLARSLLLFTNNQFAIHQISVKRIVSDSNDIHDESNIFQFGELIRRLGSDGSLHLQRVSQQSSSAIVESDQLTKLNLCASFRKLLRCSKSESSSRPLDRVAPIHTSPDVIEIEAPRNAFEASLALADVRKRKISIPSKLRQISLSKGEKFQLEKNALSNKMCPSLSANVTPSVQSRVDHRSSLPRHATNSGIATAVKENKRTNSSVKEEGSCGLDFGGKVINVVKERKPCKVCGKLIKPSRLLQHIMTEHKNAANTREKKLLSIAESLNVDSKLIPKKDPQVLANHGKKRIRTELKCNDVTEDNCGGGTAKKSNLQNVVKVLSTKESSVVVDLIKEENVSKKSAGEMSSFMALPGYDLEEFSLIRASENTETYISQEQPAKDFSVPISVDFLEFRCFYCNDDKVHHNQVVYTRHWMERHGVCECDKSNLYTLSCRQCSEVFHVETDVDDEAVAGLLTHLVECHRFPIPDYIQSYSCSECQRKFLNETLLYRHATSGECVTDVKEENHQENDKGDHQASAIACYVIPKVASVPNSSQPNLPPPPPPPPVVISAPKVQTGKLRLSSYRCFLCESDKRVFPSEEHYLAHVRDSHVLLGEYRCSIACPTCKSSYLVDDDYYRCLEIGGDSFIGATTLLYKTLQFILKHMMNAHDLELPSYVEAKFRCPKPDCKFFTSKKVALCNHILTHDAKKTACPVCGKLYKTNLLHQHLSIHRTGVKQPTTPVGEPSLVALVGKVPAAKPRTVGPVRRVPSKPSDIVCSICEQRFTTKLRSVSHAFRCHGENTEMRPVLRCADCEYETIYRCDLDTHRRRTHGIDTGFKCTVCAKTFKSYGSLHSHSKCHVKKKLFACAERKFKTARKHFMK